jgi:hypothetical protein
MKYISTGSKGAKKYPVEDPPRKKMIETKR